jgi:tRNA dimethylallyltransferase
MIRVPLLTGPTASGKTELALEFARCEARAGRRVELVNADSLLVYRGMDIGTAKPSREELSEIPHHLVDVRDPDQPFTATEFRREALRAIDEIEARGARAVVVGGTPFYLKALIFGVWEVPPADAAIRARLEEWTTAKLFEELKRRDPELPARLHPSDRYRLVRALEIIEQGGPAPSALEAQERALVPDPRFPLVVVDRATPELYERIDARTREMLAQGLLDETRRIREAFPRARPLESVGYFEACAFLDGRKPEGRAIRPGLDGLADEISLSTRQLVKKQRTFLKNLLTRLPEEGRSTFLLPDEEGPALACLGTLGAGASQATLSAGASQAARD